MDTRLQQSLFANTGHYKGDIDGDAGPMTMKAVDIIEHNGGFKWDGWSKSRRLIAAAQVVLTALGYEPGTIDGLEGNNTREALTSFQTKEVTGKPVLIERIPGPDYAPTAGQSEWPLQRDMDSFYGKPGNVECTAGKCFLPFPFQIAWDASQHVTSVSCHRKVATALTGIFKETANHYGRDLMEAYGLMLFGGCYSLRKMRGGSSWSVHAYGAAVDIDPDNNQLRWGRDRARFAKEEYQPFWKIVEAHGAVSLGRAANMDWMHFQFARL